MKEYKTIGQQLLDDSADHEIMRNNWRGWDIEKLNRRLEGNQALWLYKDIVKKLKYKGHVFTNCIDMPDIQNLPATDKDGRYVMEITISDTEKIVVLMEQAMPTTELIEVNYYYNHGLIFQETITVKKKA